MSTYDPLLLSSNCLIFLSLQYRREFCDRSYFSFRQYWASIKCGCGPPPDVLGAAAWLLALRNRLGDMFCAQFGSWTRGSSPSNCDLLDRSMLGSFESYEDWWADSIDPLKFLTCAAIMGSNFDLNLAIQFCIHLGPFIPCFDGSVFLTMNMDDELFWCKRTIETISGKICHVFL